MGLAALHQRKLSNVGTCLLWQVYKQRFTTAYDDYLIVILDQQHAQLERQVIPLNTKLEEYLRGFDPRRALLLKVGTIRIP